ncbi:unnamed protein product [Amoebophrya sp. A120]|nr:unnamed protein product [Amoebophrya sp. A120]|eukprot:GSA120T00014146001.1
MFIVASIFLSWQLVHALIFTTYQTKRTLKMYTAHQLQQEVLFFSSVLLLSFFSYSFTAADQDRDSDLGLCCLSSAKMTNSLIATAMKNIQLVLGLLCLGNLMSCCREQIY